MNALSVFSGVCAFFAAAVFGLWIKKRFVRRAAFYEDYYDYLLFASEKISYERMPLDELNARYCKRRSGDFSVYLREHDVAFLREDEKIEVKSYLDTIGTTDADTQVASLSAKCAELKRFTENECAKYRKDGALYFKLAVLVGVAVFILLV